MGICVDLLLRMSFLHYTDKYMWINSYAMTAAQHRQDKQQENSHVFDNELNENSLLTVFFPLRRLKKCVQIWI